MTKRIVSGIFILTALGALGVILAGALTSGEQLIVRFLTAVIVAALGLYVISDLRLQADDDAMTARSGGHPRLSTVDAPPNSTAAFMATVTKRADRRKAETGETVAAGGTSETREKAEQQMVGDGTTTSSATERSSAAVEDAGSTADPTSGEEPIRAVTVAPETVRAAMPPPRNEIGLTELFAARASAEIPATRPSAVQPAMPPMPTALGGSTAEQAEGIGAAAKRPDNPFETPFGAANGPVERNPGAPHDGSVDNTPDVGTDSTADQTADNAAGDPGADSTAGERGRATFQSGQRADDDADRYAAETRVPDHGEHDSIDHEAETLEREMFASATPFEEAQLAVAAMNASGSDGAGGAPYYGSYLNGAGRNGKPANGTHRNGAYLNGSTLSGSPLGGHPGSDSSDDAGPRRLLSSLDIFGERPGDDGFDDRNDDVSAGEAAPIEVDIEIEVFEPGDDDERTGGFTGDTGVIATGTDNVGDAAMSIGGTGTGRGESDTPADDRPVENITAMADFQYSDDLQSPQQEWPPLPAEPVEPRRPVVHPFEKASAAYQAEKDRLAAAASVTADLPVLARQVEIEAADYADAPLAPIIDLREVNRANPGSIDAAINAGEVEVITTLIEQGMLSTDGPISDRDVRTMVYVAFTSNELRKLLLAGGTPDGPNHGLDLGPVELFDEQVHAPAPKKLYSGLPLQQRQPQSQIG